MRDYKATKASQQHRLQKQAPTPSTAPETTPDPSQPGPAVSNLTVATGPEVTHTSGATGTTEEPTTATPQTAAMEISPEEEAELLSETYAAPEEMEVSLQFFSPPTSPHHD